MQRSMRAGGNNSTLAACRCAALWKTPLATSLCVMPYTLPYRADVQVGVVQGAFARVDQRGGHQEGGEYNLGVGLGLGMACVSPEGSRDQHARVH